MEIKAQELKYWKDQKPPDSDTLFEDELFRPDRNSLLGYDSNGRIVDLEQYEKYPKEREDFEKIEFKRASEIFKNKYELFSGKIEVNDIKQGALGNCYFLTALSNICKIPGLIYNEIFKTKKVSKNGCYEIIIRIDGTPTILILDDYFPVFKTTQKPCFAQPHGNEIWVLLLEKAWAKINGGYYNTIGGSVNEPMEFLTGFGSRIYYLSNLDEESKKVIIEEMKDADQSNCFISCGTKKDKEIEKYGLVPGHAYSILELNEIEAIDQNNINLIRLRNPWSEKEWTGDWSDDSILWDDKTKSQVKYVNQDEGIFFMSDTDLFKYFSHIQICYMLYNSTSVRYTIEGEENLRNGIVFNLQIENDGLLYVSVIRKHWRVHREIRNKISPTHISIVKYNTNPKNKYQTFYDYSGTTKSNETSTLNKKVEKGNYLLYIYRDTEHSEYILEPKLEVEIVCSSNFKHAQMNYDLRDKGFPLLQNIILQSVLEEKKFDFSLYTEGNYNTWGHDFKNNGLGYFIFYGASPGSFYELSAITNLLTNTFVISPYLPDKQTEFKQVFPSKKFIVLLILRKNDEKNHGANLQPIFRTVNGKIVLDYYDNDIDLNIFTDINNDIKNANLKIKKTHSLDEIKVDIDFNIEYYELSELEKEYPEYFALMKKQETGGDGDIDTDKDLAWGKMKINNNIFDNYLYVGQFKDRKKEGLGIIIQLPEIYIGTFKNDKKNGIIAKYIYSGEEFLVKSIFTYQDDIRNDYAIIFYTNGKYHGKFLNGRNGVGTYYYDDGSRYEGEWVKNLREGVGMFYYSKTGNIYRGEWEKDKKHGKGIMHYKNGKRYKGEWRDDKKWGYGLLYNEKGIIYHEGFWKNGMREGKGTFYYSDGRKYDGEWKQDLRQGKGILYFKSGGRYEGDWVNDKPEGNGVKYYTNGDREMGNYKKGKPVGFHAYLYSDGKVERKDYGGDLFDDDILGDGNDNLDFDKSDSSSEYGHEF